MSTYSITRHYMHDDHKMEVVATGLTLDEALAHCQDPETSSHTATSDVAADRTAKMGPWFDGFTRSDA